MTQVKEHLTPRNRTTLILLAGALTAWAVTIDRMRGMDDGPGTDWTVYGLFAYGRYRLVSSPLKGSSRFWRVSGVGLG